MKVQEGGAVLLLEALPVVVAAVLGDVAPLVLVAAAAALAGVAVAAALALWSSSTGI